MTEHNYSKVYSDCIWSTIELMGSFKELIQNNDLQGLAQTRGLLKANKTILSSLYSDSCAIYQEKKKAHNDKKDELYLENRKTMSQGDAEKKARLDTRDLRDDVDEYKIKKDKSYRFMEDCKDLVIEISVIIKESNNLAKYG